LLCLWFGWRSRRDMNFPLKDEKNILKSNRFIFFRESMNFCGKFGWRLVTTKVIYRWWWMLEFGMSGDRGEKLVFWCTWPDKNKILRLKWNIHQFCYPWSDLSWTLQNYVSYIKNHTRMVHGGKKTKNCSIRSRKLGQVTSDRLA